MKWADLTDHEGLGWSMMSDMGDFAIKAENIGKKYKIGHRKSGDFRESFGNFLSRICSNGESHKSNIQVPEHHHQEPATSLKDFWALKDVSFEIKPGEAVGIIGRNGAGKSTLLKILSRITEPTTGKFWINGRVSSLLEVGTGFHMELTGSENIYLNGTILGMKRREIKAKFDEIVAFSGVEQFIDTPVKHYSSGMKVRLAFSVAAHLEPEILLIDEVLAVGDAEFQKKCLGRMEDVTKKGKAILFVSHNLAAIEKLCQKVLLLDKGILLCYEDTKVSIGNYFKTIHRNTEVRHVGDIPRRSGYDKIITDISIEDENGNILTIISQKQKVFFRINYEYNREILDPHFGILFKDKYDNNLIWLQSKLNQNFVEKIPNKGTVICEISSLPLSAGKYKVSIGCGSKNIQLDFVDEACELFVENTDFFGSGRMPESKQSLFLLESKWIYN